MGNLFSTGGSPAGIKGAGSEALDPNTQDLTFINCCTRTNVLVK